MASPVRAQWRFSATRPRRLLRITGWATAGILMVATATSGLPAGMPARVATLAMTAVGLALWCLVLLPRITDVRVLTAALLASGLLGAALDVVDRTGPGFVLAYMALTGIGLGLPQRRALPVAIVVTAAGALAEAHVSAHPVATALTFCTGAAVLFLATMFAATSRDAQAQAQALLEQEAAARSAREEAAALAERGRIARELHDVLAHSLSGLALQLEGARLLAERTGADPRLTEQVTQAQRLAREGLLSARRAVATLRGEQVPGVDQLPQLIEQSRLAGLPATLTVTGTPRPLPADTGLAVYRVVQEALTNAAKHAGQGATAVVAVVWDRHGLTAQVTDSGGGGPAAGLPSGGYGLAGLAERAALAGGRLDAGPSGDGWRVSVSMPVPDPSVEATS